MCRKKKGGATLTSLLNKAIVINYNIIDYS